MATDPVLLTRYTQDLSSDIRGLARYIGNLEQGRSKVSVNSTLSVGDRVDHFRFRVTGGSESVRIRTGELIGTAGEGKDVAPNGTVRYQLLSPSGRVIADSDPNAGEASEAWRDLNSDANLRLNRGSYTLRVSRGREAVASKEYIYSFTFRSGDAPIAEDTEETAFREFLTTERPALPGSAGDGLGNTNVTAVLGLFVNVRV